MKLVGRRFKKVTLLLVAVHAFLFAICAKGVYFYASNHPPKEQLLSVRGTVSDIRLGGHGKATTLSVKSDSGTRRYSSYYGVVWPGMEHIHSGDRVTLLAERNRLNRNELISGKSYYIWQLTHQGQTIIDYENVRELVQSKEVALNRYINLWLVTSFAFLLITYLRKMIMKSKGSYL